MIQVLEFIGKWNSVLASIWVLGVSSTVISAAEDRHIYQDESAPLDARFDDLMVRMTLDEKVENNFDPRPHRRRVEVVNRLQRVLLENTRLKILALIGSECLHGHTDYNSPIFPTLQ